MQGYEHLGELGKNNIHFLPNWTPKLNIIIRIATSISRKNMIHPNNENKSALFKRCYKNKKSWCIYIF